MTHNKWVSGSDQKWFFFFTRFDSLKLVHEVLRASLAADNRGDGEGGLAPHRLPNTPHTAATLQKQQEHSHEEAFPLTEERFSNQSNQTGRAEWGGAPRIFCSLAPSDFAMLCPRDPTPPAGLRKGEILHRSPQNQSMGGGRSGSSWCPQQQSLARLTPLTCLQRRGSNRAPWWPD